MNTPQLTRFEHPSAWTAAEMAPHLETWCVTLPAGVVAELQAEAARADRSSLAAITRHLPDRDRLRQAAIALAEIEHEVMAGRGFVLLKGLDPALDDAMLKACYWVMINLLGKPISQNSYGDVLCDVMDTGKKLGEKRTRGYQTNAHLKFHTDRSALVGLLCVRKARSGGCSSISSAISVFNVLLERRPDLVPVMINGLNYMNIEEGGDQSLKRVPIFDVRDNVLSCRYSRNTMATAILNGAPFTDLEKEALEVVDGLADDRKLRLDMTLERGDIQLINNYTTFHARTDFEDFPDPQLKRCMTRAWVHSTTGRPVGPHFDDYFGVPVTLAHDQ